MIGNYCEVAQIEGNCCEISNTEWTIINVK